MTDHLRPELTVSTQTEDGRVRVIAAGEIDLYTVPRFTEALEHATGASQRVVVDLTEVTFMDSTGLRALLKARARLAETGGHVELALPEDSAVARLLDLAGVLGLFQGPENRL